MNLPEQILNQTKQALKNKQAIFHLKGQFHLTKSQANYSDVLLERDFSLEGRTYQYLTEKTGIAPLIRRYHQYDPELDMTNLPPHYAMRILSGAGSICSGANIFMFFPIVLGLPVRQREDSFGFEFVDIWKNIFHNSIFPCVREVFSISSQLEIHRHLQNELERTIYLASIFHELGHEVGPWRISPQPRSNMNLDGFELDVVGELSTDSLMILKMSDYPELALFIILQRLFWFTRRGFKDDPIHGFLNSDNDSWIGIYLWKKLHQHKVLYYENELLHYDSSCVSGCFQEIVNELDSLHVPNANKEIQRARVQLWMKSASPYQEHEKKFIYPEDFRFLLSRCQKIVEIPQFFPTFNYNHINQIKEIFS